MILWMFFKVKEFLFGNWIKKSSKKAIIKISFSTKWVHRHKFEVDYVIIGWVSLHNLLKGFCVHNLCFFGSVEKEWFLAVADDSSV